MAKRKRASLKDKSPETLGLTSKKKGKGIDLLFGGPVDQETDEMQESDAADSDVSGAVDNTAVDELGLPVALEEPPDDLIPAAPHAGSISGQGELDPVDPTTSPFAMPAPDSPVTMSADDTNDLSGLLEEDNSTMEEDTNLADSVNENDLSGLVVDDTSSGALGEEDLSGIVVDDSGLSGLTAAPPPSETGPDPLAGLPAAGVSGTGVDEATDLSGLVVADEGLSDYSVDATSTPSAPAPEPVAPTTPSVSSYQPPSQPAPAAQPAPAPQPQTYPPVTPPPPEPAPVRTTSQGPTAFQPGVGISSISGLVTEPGSVSARDILPEDALTETGDNVLAVEKRETLERDEAATEKIIRYIGPERRKQLDDEIMQLYQTISDELSDNKEDASFALKTLKDAQDIVIEDISQYDEAVYRVAVVRTMLVRKQNLRRWSYSWGMFVFFYALIWLVLFVAGIYFIDPDAAEATSAGASAIRSAWLSSLAGGIGGVIAILYSLSWRVAIKHEFDRQYIMKYLVQPIMGFVLGALMFFITSAGFLVFNSTNITSGEDAFLGGPTLIAVQLILGFIAGFRQRTVYYLIDRIVQKISPEATEVKGPSSVVPTDDFRQLQPE